MQEALKDLFKNKIKFIKKKVWYTKKCTCKCTKKERLFEKGLKKIAKMQNISQNEFNQISFMHGLSQDELEQIAKKEELKTMKIWKNLIISLLKSKEIISELFNNNNNN